MEDNLLVNSQTPHLPFQLRSLGPVPTMCTSTSLEDTRVPRR